VPCDNARVGGVPCDNARVGGVPCDNARVGVCPVTVLGHVTTLEWGCAL